MLQKNKLPIILALLSNAYVVFGVLFLGFNIGTIIGIYIAQSVILGLMVIIKIWVLKYIQKGSFFSNLFITFFFILHYGVFQAGYVAIVFYGAGDLFTGQQMIPDIIQVLIASIFFVIQIIERFSNDIKIIIVQGKDGNINSLFSIYSRVFFTHAVILFGGLWVNTMSKPIAIMIIFIGLKTIGEIFLLMLKTYKGDIGRSRIEKIK